MSPPYDDNDSERTQVLLTSAAFVHLKQLEFSKHTRNLSPASREILLSGPAGMLMSLYVLNRIVWVFMFVWLMLVVFSNFQELHQQMLAKALAHHLESKLLLLDITDFSRKVIIFIFKLYLNWIESTILTCPISLFRYRANMDVRK